MPRGIAGLPGKTEPEGRDPMYVILTSKPGQFRTEIVDGLRPLAAYDYLFYGVKKATFVIAELLRDTKVRVIDEAWSPQIVNEVPSKFLEKFETPERAFSELQHLTSFGHMDTKLRKL
ncbi:ferredoxin [Bradyrhizobium sp. AZCC 2289]|uniref:ferredoxin n=1 Tax=Bradyrhizobium sp. AZCC 2289 TaxID=3117026 RepID=UPI002FF1F9FC